MPISAVFVALQNLIKNAYTLDVAGKPDLTSLTYASAIASIAPSGIMPMGTVMVPLVPAGLSATQAMMKNCFELGVAGKTSLTSMMMAQAISVLCPMVPPFCTNLLQIMLENVYKLDIAGKPELASMMEASAIISYFVSGGVL